jgi:hypothetical protein
MAFTAEYYKKHSELIPYHIPWLTSERLIDYQVVDLLLEHTPSPNGAVAVVSFWTNHKGYQRCYLNAKRQRIETGSCTPFFKNSIDSWLNELKETSL